MLNVTIVYSFHNPSFIYYNHDHCFSSGSYSVNNVTISGLNENNDVNEALVIDSVIIIKGINNSSVNNTSNKSEGISFHGNNFLILFHHTFTLYINNNAMDIRDLLLIKA